jgi:hypothetical protein
MKMAIMIRDVMIGRRMKMSAMFKASYPWHMMLFSLSWYDTPLVLSLLPKILAFIVYGWQ